MGFTFKQFHIDDDRCGMKVGTDSVLLGSCIDVTCAKSVLDIGSGSGLLGLMMAQKMTGEGQIDCVEIDPQACEQAKENVANSPWPESVRIINQDINTFVSEKSFDLIVSNPPYFVDALQSPDKARNTARHTCELSLAELAENVARLLNDDGQFWLILPPDSGERLTFLARKVHLHLQQLIRVHTKVGKPIHRHIMRFAKITTEQVAQSDIAVYDENNQYSRHFIALTKNFYLNR